MKNISIFLLVIGLVLASVTTAFATAPDVYVKNKEGVGDYLVDAKGMTLYWSKLDAPGGSTCKAQCLIQWPPFYKEAVLSSSPHIKSTDFGTIVRSDGKRQNTFRGYPLYYYTMDKKSGDTIGNELENVWFVMNPGLFKIVEDESSGRSKSIGTNESKVTN